MKNDLGMSRRVSPHFVSHLTEDVPARTNNSHRTYRSVALNCWNKSLTFAVADMGEASATHFHVRRDWMNRSQSQHSTISNGGIRISANGKGS